MDKQREVTFKVQDCGKIHLDPVSASSPALSLSVDSAGWNKQGLREVTVLNYLKVLTVFYGTGTRPCLTL